MQTYISSARTQLAVRGRGRQQGEGGGVRRKNGAEGRRRNSGGRWRGGAWGWWYTGGVARGTGGGWGWGDAFNKHTHTRRRGRGGSRSVPQPPPAHGVKPGDALHDAISVRLVQLDSADGGRVDVERAGALARQAGGAPHRVQRHVVVDVPSLTGAQAVRGGVAQRGAGRGGRDDAGEQRRGGGGGGGGLRRGEGVLQLLRSPGDWG